MCPQSLSCVCFLWDFSPCENQSEPQTLRVTTRSINNLQDAIKLSPLTEGLIAPNVSSRHIRFQQLGDVVANRQYAECDTQASIKFY